MSASDRSVPPEILAEALARSSEGMIVTDASQDIIFANGAIRDLTGYTEDDLLGRNCRLLQGPATDPGTVHQIHGALTAGESFRGTILNYRKDGQPFWNDLSITPLRDASGIVTHFVSVQRDSSEIVVLRENLREQLVREKRETETARLLLKVARLLGEYRNVEDVTDAIAEGIRDICSADRSAVALWDTVAERLRMGAQAGWPDHLGEKVSRFSVTSGELPELATLVADGRPVLIGADASPAMQELLIEYEATAFAAVPIFSRGELRGILLAYWVTSPAPSQMSGAIEERLDGLGHMAAVALENATLLDHAVWSGTHDALTELPNRQLLERFLRRHLDLGSAQPGRVAALYVDIDRFKETNDALGHYTGDRVLHHVASVLKSATREGDLVARVGGDEFVIAVADQHASDAARFISDRVRARLKEPIFVNDQEISISVAVGIAVASSFDPDSSVEQRAEDLLTAADASMYEDKAVRSASTGEATEGRELAIDTALHGAVARGEITARFQPQLHLRTNTIGTVEALARWHHPILGDVNPADFIPVAERNGMIHEIGKEIRRRACDLAAAARAAASPVAIAFNASVVEFTHADFFDDVAATLTRLAIAPEHVTIELTESLFVADIPDVTARIERFRALGVQISLDDFGTGNTSVLQLYDLPVTELKIDQAFIRKDGPVGEALIGGIVAMAHSIGISVVTEGVETLHQLSAVRRLGSDRAQGYHIAHPMTHVDALAWLRLQQEDATSGSL